jgi:hypothetical protein
MERGGENTSSRREEGMQGQGGEEERITGDSNGNGGEWGEAWKMQGKGKDESQPFHANNN